MTKLSFSQECKYGLIEKTINSIYHSNRLKGEKHIITSTDVEKHF